MRGKSRTLLRVSVRGRFKIALLEKRETMLRTLQFDKLYDIYGKEGNSAELVLWRWEADCAVVVYASSKYFWFRFSRK